MEKGPLKEELLIERDKWQDILRHFTDVLKMNLFLVDPKGAVMIPPLRECYGWSFFEKKCLGVTQSRNRPPVNLLTKFQQGDQYWAYRCESGLQGFAIPIKVEQEKILAYLIVGPVIIDKKEETPFYQQIAEKLKWDADGVLEAVAQVREVPFKTMHSILDLLSQVAKDVVELNWERRKLAHMQINRENLPKAVSDAAQDIYATIHLDELMITLLDVALKMTDTECGSIMMLDNNRELGIRASRGLEEKARTRRLKMGEGIAGLAAKENSQFVIHGIEGENRIKHLLKRPDIQHAIVMPISVNDRVCGVLNLHTKRSENQIDENLENLQYLSKLISAAFHCF